MMFMDQYFDRSLSMFSSRSTISENVGMASTLVLQQLVASPWRTVQLAESAAPSRQANMSEIRYLRRNRQPR